jgi:hypothetical protein
LEEIYLAVETKPILSPLFKLFGRIILLYYNLYLLKYIF